ncbi:MAG: hypothetical protein H6807_14600 [Planctomycetes bacterium]|nr:hypothetical protein [Planctomycetota bacterium]
MLRTIAHALLALILLGGLMADGLAAQRRGRDDGNPGVRSRGPEPAPRVQPTPRAQPQPSQRIQTPPSRRSEPVPRAQPTPRAQPQPSQRVQTPPSRRSEPSPRIQTPPTPRPTPRAQPSPRPTPTPRAQPTPTPTPRAQPVPTPRAQPTPRSATPERRRVQTPSTGGQIDSGSSRRTGTDASGRSRIPTPSRDVDRSARGSGDDGSRGLDSLKRYTDRRNGLEENRRRRVEADSGGETGSTRSNQPSGTGSRVRVGSSNLGSGSVPGSGFSGGGAAPRQPDSSGGNRAETGGTGYVPQARSRTVFPGSSGESSARGIDPGSERSRGGFGRGGLTTISPTGTTSRSASHGRVASDLPAADAPRPRARDGVEIRRLQPIDGGGRATTGGRSNSAEERRGIRTGYFRGSDFWGLDRREHRRDSGSFSFYFGFGGGRDYCGSYLLGASYGSYWDYWTFGIRTPYHLGYSSPAHVYFGYQSDFRRHARYHFGYNVYLPCTRYSPYPLYRTCYWQPWYVDYWANVCPTYRSYHVIYEDYDRRPGVGYWVETADPYVEEEVLLSAADFSGGYEEVAPLGPELDGGVPIAFQRSFSDAVPLDLDFEGLLAWGEEALYSTDYLGAAEAFRRAAKLRWEDDYPKFQLALALFGAERYDLAYLALELGLDQNPAWLYRRFDLRDAFASVEEFQSRQAELERYLIRNERNDQARFLLGYVYYFSDNLFGARSVVRILSESASGDFRHLDILAREAEKRILRQNR